MSPTNVKGTLFFRANDGIFGWELWRSDGTTAGTALVEDIKPKRSSSTKEPTEVDGTLFFVAGNGRMVGRYGRATARGAERCS